MLGRPSLSSEQGNVERWTFKNPDTQPRPFHFPTSKPAIHSVKTDFFFHSFSFEVYKSSAFQFRDGATSCQKWSKLFERPLSNKEQVVLIPQRDPKKKKL